MWKSALLLFFVPLLNQVQCENECVSRDYGNGGTVCVCNATYCDTIQNSERAAPYQYVLYTSNQNGLRFGKSVNEFTLFPQSQSTENEIRIERLERYQTILGWGGAFTDATGINIASLEEDVQEKLLRSYFADDGIEYNLCRVPMAGTDFSTHQYTYDDGSSDPELKNFALAYEDYTYKIPFIKKARELTKDKLRLFACPWMAPSWMTTNGKVRGPGYILPDMYQAWANYFLKFLDRYQEEGLSFWGISTANEPNDALYPEDKMNIVGWNSSELGEWILYNLGPTIRSSIHADIQIIIFDDMRLYLPEWVDQALENWIARAYVNGIAVHWYADAVVNASVLTETHDHFPEKFLLSTEACEIPAAGAPAVVLGSWADGESYSSDIIQDLHHWVSGWVDWNMALDLTGGPNWINNFVDSPVIVNATAGEFYKQPMFYHIGHFAKFVPRGSVRIGTSSNIGENVTSVAFERPDGGTAIVILNKNTQAVPVVLTDLLKGTAQVQLSEKSITTILYW